MLNLGADLSLGSLYLAYCFVQHAAFSVLLVDAAPDCNLPGDLAFSILFALLDTGIACIGADHVLITV